MGESLWLHERCLALQLVRDEPPPSRPAKLPRSRQLHHMQQGRPSNSSSRHNAEAWCSSIITPTSPSTDSDTPTPTNGGLPTIPTSPTTNVHSPSNLDHLNKYQDGYLLFQAWQAANTVCVWNVDLMAAVREAVYVGLLVGGILLVGGSSKVLATITHAWSRSLLVAPTGFTLTMLGEVSGCKMVAVPQGHFTPLADALCWVIHRLSESGDCADPETLHSTLTASFPTLNTPDSTIIHATLSNLIHQRKVYHSGSSYGIVYSNTYQLTPVIGPSSSPSHAKVSPSHSHQAASQSFLETTDLRPPQGGAQLISKDGLYHAIVQTDLAELITGVTLPTDKIITPTPQASVRGIHSSLERQASLGLLTGRRHHSRTASLRLSPTKVAQLATAFSQSSVTTTICNSNVYEAKNMNDITIKGERGSVLSKLLRVSPRRRLASFSAQFPPKEWTDTSASVIHLHSVAVQTSSRQRKESNDLWWSSVPSWAPRSSTLPRRLRRPLSCTPPLSRSSNSATPPLMQASSHHVLGPESLHMNSHSMLHVPSHATPTHHPHVPCKGSLDRLQSEPLHFYQNRNKLSHDNYRLQSRSHQSVDGQRLLCDDLLDAMHSVHTLNNKMVVRKQGFDGPSQNGSPVHHVSGIKSQIKVAKKPPNQHSKRSEEGLTKKLGELHLKKLGEELKGKELTCVHQQKHKLHPSSKGKHQKLHETSCRHKSLEKDQKKTPNSQEDKNYETNDYDETPVRDQPNIINKENNSHNLVSEISKQHEEKEKEEKPESPQLTRKEESTGNNEEDVRKENSILETIEQGNDSGHYNRSSLQLDLTLLHMNNSKKVVSSPHRPEGLKNNMLHDNKGMNITKGSSHELTNRNLGYRDVDKCHKQPCSQTLDEAHQVSEQKQKEQVSEPVDQEQQHQQQHLQDQVTRDLSSKSKVKLHRSPKKKSVSSTLKDPNIMTEDKNKVSSKAVDKVSPDESNIDAKKVSSDNIDAKKVSPDTEVASINTYPSLSELNLNFSSLAAQKILHGVSHNSIDTLVEVNLAAEKRKVNVKRPEAVTNTDFGFL